MGNIPKEFNQKKLFHKQVNPANNGKPRSVLISGNAGLAHTADKKDSEGGEDGDDDGDSKTTNELIILHEQFMQEAKYSLKRAPATLSGYKTSFDLLMKLLPGTTLETLSSSTLTEFFKVLEERTRCSGSNGCLPKNGVKSSTIATHRSKLKPFCNWLLARGRLDKDPFKDIAAPKISYDAPQYLKKEQMDKIITAIEAKILWPNLFLQKRNAAIITTMLGCGLRRGEILNLKIYDVDLKRRELSVHSMDTKNRVAKTIPLSTLAHRKLEDYMAERKKKGYATPLLFAAYNADEGITGVGFKKMIELVSRESGVKFHAHQLRHTFAMNLLAKGIGLPIVQRLMGHKSLLSTIGYIRNLPDKIMKESVEKIRFDNLI